MTTSSTVRMRLRGLTVRHALAAVVTASPLLLTSGSWALHRLSPTLPLWIGSALLALVPWVGRALVRRATACKCDDVAVHLGGEALPYRTIKKAWFEAGARRTVLVLERSPEIVLRLVWWDSVAGRLAPTEALRERMAKSDVPLPPAP